MKAMWELLKGTFSEWNEDNAPRLAAALAFYTMFTLAPLLVVVIAVAGLAFGREAAQGQIVGQIQGLVGVESAKAIQNLIEQLNQPESGAIATFFGLATLLLGAWWVFGELQDAMNVIWEVRPKPGLGMLALLKARFVSFTMMLGVGFLLLVSLVVSAAVAALGTFLGGMLTSLEPVLHIFNFVVSFAVITLLFAMIYKILPDVLIGWGDVWIGAAATSLLYSIGKFLIGLYLGRSSVGSAYGAAGSLVIILVWVYYSAQILFFGAEFTKVYARRYSSHIVPTEIAVSITPEARAHEGIPHAEQVAAAVRDQELRIAAASNSHARADDHEGTRQRGGMRRFDRYAAAVLGFIVGVFVSVAYIRGTERA